MSLCVCYYQSRIKCIDCRFQLLKPTATPCKKYDDLVDAEDASQAEYFNVQYAEMFQVLGEGTGIANFSYKNINKVYDVHREVRKPPADAHVF